MISPIALLSLVIAAASGSEVRAQTATTFTEREIVWQSKLCEVATRLSYGDVSEGNWSDCMLHQRVRSTEEQAKNFKRLNTSWADAWKKSLVNAKSEGCFKWSEKQPDEPRRAAGVSIHNHAWNLCMEREGVFSVPTTRKFLDYETLIVEKHPLLIWVGNADKTVYGCHTEARYLEIKKAEPMSPGSWPTGPEDVMKREEDYKVGQKKLRDLVTSSKDCRVWQSGERVQLIATSKSLLLCVSPLSPSSSNDPCYWTPKIYTRVEDK